MSPYQRYLMYVSYLGSQFRGSQIQNRLGVYNTEVTVQGTIETSLGHCLGIPGDRVRVHFSSRTDAGVHALKSAAHFDLPPIQGKFISPKVIQKLLNQRFSKTNHHLRHVLEVPDEFHARYLSVEKVYMYRLGILKDEYLTLERHIYPITESHRTFFPRINQFCLKKCEEVAQLFIGEKNFVAFAGKSLRNTAVTTCKINSTFIKKTEAFMPIVEPLAEKFDFYHIVFSGTRFLHHMVRKMVGVILAVAANKITVDDAKDLIDGTKPENFMSRVSVPPGYGLYLLDVLYKPEHLIMTEIEKNKKNNYLTC